MDPYVYKRFVKQFIAFVAVAVFGIGGVSFVLYSMNIPYTQNDLLLQYQLQKLTTASHITTVVVGDSSAGNAISADLFSSLTGTRTLNLALTGSFGIEGSYTMLRQALHAHPTIRYVLVVQSLDVWRRPFSEQGVLDTERGLPPCAFPRLCTHPLAVAKYLFNPKEILWALEYQWGGPPVFAIEDDFIKQNDKTYANGGLGVDSVRPLSSVIDPSKPEVLEMLGQLCHDSGLKCVYIHGPLHEGVVTKSLDTIDAINARVSAVPSIRFTPEFPVLQQGSVGDSLDHVERQHKAETTRWYAAEFTALTKIH